MGLFYIGLFAGFLSGVVAMFFLMVLTKGDHMQMLAYEVGAAITSSGNSPEDKPRVGEVRNITHYATQIVLAKYRIKRVDPPRQPGGLWMIYGEIVEVNG